MLQAEEDCKVLLGAIHAERQLSEQAVGHMASAASAAEAALIADQAKLKLAADELPQASAAATTIQKHFRGMQARKE